MSNPVLVEVTRGNAVESLHRGAIAVVDAEGRLVRGVGDVTAPIYPRSALKPLQAIPLITSGAARAFGLGEREMALACASHSGEPFHVEAVAAWLARIGATEEDLACGPHLPLNEAAALALTRQGLSPTRLHNNCSGKHAGFLSVAKAIGVPFAGYEAPDGPVQDLVKAAIARFCAVDPAALPPALDGCHAPAFRIPLLNLAQGLARFATGRHLPAAEADAARTLLTAVRARPDYVAGHRRLCTALIPQLTDGLVKSGAEGSYAAALPGLGLGVAIKIDDGTKRAAETALVATLVRLGALDGAYPLATALCDTTGVVIGECRPAAALTAMMPR
jgi:L-asparaginase II